MWTPLPLLISLAGTAVVAAGGSVWWASAPAVERVAMAPEETPLPLPPEAPRLSDDPAYDRCLALLRDDVDEALRFAQAWEATGGAEGAQHCFALAMIGQGDLDRAAERLERLAASSRANNQARAAVFGQAAQTWMMADDPNRAFGAVTMGLTLAPDDAELLVDRSVILGSQRRYREALDDLDRVLVLEPDRAEAHVFRAATLRHLDQVEPARAAVERALVLVPDNAEALLERGILRQLRGDDTGARADWERAVEVAPDSVAADLARQNLSLSELGPQQR